MTQINIRITEEEKRLISEIAGAKGLSNSEFIKRAVMNEIRPIRMDIIFDLVKKGKIGRKKAWTLSGLSYREFLLEWADRKAEEIIPEALMDENLEEALQFDPKPFLKNKI